MKNNPYNPTDYLNLRNILEERTYHVLCMRLGLFNHKEYSIQEISYILDIPAEMIVQELSVGIDITKEKLGVDLIKSRSPNHAATISKELLEHAKITSSRLFSSVPKPDSHAIEKPARVSTAGDPSGTSVNTNIIPTQTSDMNKGMNPIFVIGSFLIGVAILSAIMRNSGGTSNGSTNASQNRFSSSTSDDYVRGYTRNNGVEVQPHYRTQPNSSFTDNYSTKPNINPYTGKKGTHTKP